MPEDTIFQTSDLAGKKRIEFVEAARAGSARLRDKDGTSLVMLPEARVEALRRVTTWSGHLLRLQELLVRDSSPSVSDLGELAWLRVFDRDDLQEFADELHQVLIASISDEDTGPLEEAINAWRVTAQALDDPLRRSVLLRGEHSPANFVPAERPKDAR
jgi:hypothetical protein